LFIPAFCNNFSPINKKFQEELHDVYFPSYASVWQSYLDQEIEINMRNLCMFFASANPKYVKFVACKLNVSRLRHICNLTFNYNQTIQCERKCTSRNIYEIFKTFRVVIIQVRGLLDYDAVSCCGRMSVFRRTLLLPSSGTYDNTTRHQLGMHSI
jgi:hypothetical protein